MLGNVVNDFGNEINEFGKEINEFGHEIATSGSGRNDFENGVTTLEMK